MNAEKLRGIKARVALGRQQGGNPETSDGRFNLYHLALDDMEALIAHVEEHPEEPAEEEEPEKAKRKTKE